MNPRFRTSPGGHESAKSIDTYYLYFSKIKPEVILLIQNNARTLWHLTKTDQKESAYQLMKSIADQLSNIYNIEKISGIGTTEFEYYMPMMQHIGLPKPSLVSLLHEYRHHMQHHGLGHYDNIEDDARGWSHSVFAKSLPNAFDKGWRDGKIWFLPPYNPNWQSQMNTMIRNDEELGRLS